MAKKAALPVGTPFEPNRSGNPAGRPKGSLDIKMRAARSDQFGNNRRPDEAKWNTAWMKNTNHRISK
jgi:hypothetical protein